MKKSTKLLFIIAVVLLVVLAILIFLKVFMFDNTTIDNNVNKELVEQLYEYIPDDNEYQINSIYTTHYVQFNNINYSTISIIIYNYIINNEEFLLEKVNDNEVSNLSNVLYKIELADFKKCMNIIFGDDVSYEPKDFTIDNTKSAKVINNYIYVYESNNDLKDNYIVYKQYDSYTITDDGNTIQIYEYYLKCDKTTFICYDDDNTSYINNKVKYSDNLNINDYKDNLRKYVHTYRLKNDNYYWESIETI